MSCRTDTTNGIDMTFFSAANGNLIGQSRTYGLTTDPGIGATAIEVGVGEFMDAISRESMPIAGMPMYLVATPIVAQRASSILRQMHVDTRGTDVEIVRSRPMLEGLTVLAEPYFKTALGNPAFSATGPTVQGVTWVLDAGWGYDAPPSLRPLPAPGLSISDAAPAQPAVGHGRD